jgi:hypothetical protein
MISLSRVSHVVQRSVAAMALGGVVAMASSSTLEAQGFELVGARARGMGGAFVAVADDASATWWNPAGLPSTLIFDGVADLGALTFVPDRPIEEASRAGQEQALLVAASFPVAALSYTRVHQWRLEPVPTAGVPGSRQEGGRVPAGRSLLTQHFGVSLAQSLGDAIVVGVTARLVRGGVSSAEAISGSIDEAFDRAADAPRTTTTRGDVDAGVLVRLSRLRLGLSARNLTAPTFTDADSVTWTLDRRVRAGVALVADRDRAGRQSWVVAADADLTRDDQVAGSWRGIGAGVEKWMAGRRVAVRGGVEASTAGTARPAATGGVSVAVPGGFFVDVAGVAGAEQRRGWGLSAHVMF